MKYRKLYENYFKLHYSQWTREGRLQTYDNIQRWWRQGYIRKLLPEDKKSQILEVGCGIGYHLYALQKLGYINLQGIDLSPEEIEIGKRNVDGADLIVGDAFNFLPLNEGKYDMIIMFNVLEHFTRDEAVQLCQLIFRSLKTGGIVLIRTHNAANPLSLYSLYIDITHEICYTESSLRDLLGLAGFSKVEVIGLRTYNSVDKLPRKIVKEVFFRPISWLSLNLFRLMYLSQGRYVRIVQPDILAKGIK